MQAGTNPSIPPLPPPFFPSCFASSERNRLSVILTLNGRRGEAMRAEKENPFAAALSALSFPSSLTGPGLKVWLQWADSAH